MKRILALLIAVAAPAWAADPEMRAGDIVLSQSDLLRLTSGNTLNFYDGGTSRFSAGGAYSYTYADDGGTAFGMFRVRDGGRICVEFRNGRSRCDLYLANGGLFYLITESGDRFPFRTQFKLSE